MRLHKVFFVPVFTFRFDKHDDYKFAEIDKLDHRPRGWTTPVNSTYPSIPDNDTLVSVDVRTDPQP